ncbi:MAG: SDR family oxidoreductase [Flavobacteriales bacterium]|nr:SDR family oxidoreductase [Flavobacteriales bacterium]MDG1781842.1 SDR family oxidoreductase [Flavobacteriales bacterium]MDG2245270.1 SDR family oxidoreductase [Flavobacteriales bacterium]
MNLDLKNKTAVVCGSTQGIGFATAKELAHMGARLVLVARNEDKLKEAVAELTTINNASHTYLVADFQHPETLDQALNGFTKDDSAHILVNNTGGPPGGQAIDAELEEFRIAFNQHLICNHLLAKHLVPGMKNGGYGRIINVISTSVKQPLNNLGVSNTIRGAVANWSKTLANELGQFGITVNNVLPGATDTARLSGIIAKKAERTGNSLEDVKQGMANQVPLKRVAQPEEVANAIAFLASPAGAYISGVNLPVDGGRTGCL